MDPNEALTRLRKLTADILAGEYAIGDEPAHELAAAFREMDDWLKVGGFLPKGWERAGETYFLAQHADDAPVCGTAGLDEELNYGGA